MPKTLYICYFGLREPLVQTQVLPYLRELIKDDVKVSLLTFEPDLRRSWSADEIAEEKARLAAIGIDWHCLGYHKWPSAPATAYDIFRGSFFVWRLNSRERFDIFHGRVHIPTLIGALARKFSRTKPKLLFDIRGFFPEEYTDAGVWPMGGWLFRGAKRVERWLLREADGFVVLTERAREILFPRTAGTGIDASGRPVEVIPCCVDISRFESANTESRTATRAELGLGDRFVATYVGAFGGWYLTKETADFFGELKKQEPDAFAMILTQSPAEMIEPLLRERGYDTEDFLIRKVPPEDVPRYLSGADVAVSFIKRCYSKQASSPTKNAEYLASGLPIIANEGVGDVDALIKGNSVGEILGEFSDAAYSQAIRKIRLLGDISERCRSTATAQFDLDSVAGHRYRRLYKRLLGVNE